MPEKGSVVLATAGRDRGELFVVLSEGERDCLIADGRRRKVLHPKRKNTRHLHATQISLLPEQYAADSRLRRALREAAHRYDDINSPDEGG